MAYFSKKTKQRIIDDYLQQTGNNMYVPQEFIDWLADRPDHEAYKAFHGRDDELLNESKLDLARRFASGLRIVAKTEVIESDVRRIKVTESGVYFSGYDAPCGWWLRAVRS